MSAPPYPKLVLVEGLPGSGKSTTSHLLALHLERHGRPVRWYWENEMPHPVVTSEAMQRALTGSDPPEEFLDGVRVNWRGLAATLGGSADSAVLESSFLQSVVHPMFLRGYDEARILAHVLEVERSIRRLSPVLVLLRQEDVAGAFEATCARRGAWFVEFLMDRMAGTPYGRAHGVTTRDGLVRYLEAYRDLSDRLVGHLGIQAVVLDARRERRSTFVGEIAAALGLPPTTDFPTSVPDLTVFTGRYQDVGSDHVLDVVTDGEHLYLDGSERWRLLHRRDGAFEVAGMCLRLDFEAKPNGRVERLACRGSLSDGDHDLVKLA